MLTVNVEIKEEFDVDGGPKTPTTALTDPLPQTRPRRNSRIESIRSVTFPFVDNAIRPNGHARKLSTSSLASTVGVAEGVLLDKDFALYLPKTKWKSRRNALSQYRRENDMSVIDCLNLAMLEASWGEGEKRLEPPQAVKYEEIFLKAEPTNWSKYGVQRPLLDAERAAYFERLAYLRCNQGDLHGMEEALKKWRPLISSNFDPALSANGQLPAIRYTRENARLLELKGLWKPAERALTQLLDKLLDAAEARPSQNLSPTMSNPPIVDALEKEIFETRLALARVLMKRGDLDKADSILDGARRICSLWLVTDQSHNASLRLYRCQLLAAEILQARGDWDGAHESFSQVYRQRNEILGRNHVETIRAALRLGGTLRLKGRWQSSEEMINMVLEEARNIFGVQHPEFLEAVGALGDTYTDQGRWREAEQLHRQALHAQEQHRWRRHPDTLKTKRQLARIYREQENWDKCYDISAEILRDGEDCFGKNHPFMLSLRADFAIASVKTGRSCEIYPFDLLQIIEQTIGPKHPETLAITVMFALELRPENCLERVQSVWKEREETLGKLHPETLFAMASVASIHMDQGRIAEAEELLSDMLRTSEDTLGWEHPQTLRALTRLAKLYLMENKLDLAKEICMLIDKTISGEMFVVDANITNYHCQALEILSRVYLKSGDVHHSHLTGASAVAKLVGKLQVTVGGGLAHALSRDNAGRLICKTFNSGQFENLKNEMKTDSNYGRHFTQRLFCTSTPTDSIRTELPQWTKSLFDLHFSINMEPLEGYMNEPKDHEARDSKINWLWSYRSKIRIKNLVSSQLPTPEMVDSVGRDGKLMGVLTHHYPNLVILEDRNVKLDSYCFSSRWMMLGQETHGAPSSLHPRLVDDVHAASSARFILRSVDFLFPTQNISFPSTSLQFVIEHFRFLDSKWKSFMKTARILTHLDNNMVLTYKGSTASLIGRLLMSAQVFSNAEEMIASHIRSAQECVQVYKESKVLLDEVELWETIEGVEKGITLSAFESLVSTLESHATEATAISAEIQRLIILEFNLVSIHEAHMSVSKTTSLQRLSWITFVFLPLLFVSSLFGMNVDVLEGNPKWWWYLVFCVALSGVVWVAWLLFRAWDDGRVWEWKMKARSIREGSVRSGKSAAAGGGNVKSTVGVRKELDEAEMARKFTFDGLRKRRTE